MRAKIQRLALLGMLMGGLMSTGMMAPAQAAGTTQIGGDAEFGGRGLHGPDPWGSTTIRGWPSPGTWRAACTPTW